VSLVPPVPAALAGFVLFFVPGLVFLALLPRRDADELPFDESLFLAVAVSVMSSAWIGLVLAELGSFSLLAAAGVLAGVALLLTFLGRRRLRWPLTRPGSWRALLPVGAVLAASLALHARPSEYLLGGRDPGTYVAAMGLIARTGGVSYTDPLVLSIPREALDLFFRHPDRPEDWSWGRFMGFPLERPQTGRVVPEHFHLFPAFGAYLFQAMGVKGALATSPVFGVLGTLAVFFTLRRLFGPAPALLAGLLLAVNIVQVWFARYPVSEPVSQFLVFSALLAFARWERSGSAALGSLAGAALGLSLLVRIDGALILVPLALYVLIRRAHRELPWGSAAPVLIPVALLSVHAAAHGLFWSRKYVMSIVERPYWSQPPHVWAALALLAAAAILAAHRHGPRVLGRLEANRPALQAAVALTVVLLAGYAYFVRPALSAWAGADGNDPHRALGNFAALDRDGDGLLESGEFASRPGGTAELFAALDGRGDGDGRLSREEWRGDPPWILARLGFRRLAAHDAQSLVRLGWFVTPLGLVLGVLGLAAVVRRWRPEYLFPVTTAVVFSGFYLYKLRIWNDYFFAWRRFVPVVLPWLLGFAAFLLWRWAASGGLRRAAAGALALALAGLYLKDTAAIASHVDWRHSVRFVADVARRFGPEDVVIFEQPGALHLLSLPLWAIHGVNVLELARYDPDRECPDCLARLIRDWRGRFRNIYFVHTYRTNLCGLFLERVPGADYRFGTIEWDRTYRDDLPRRARGHGLNFTLKRVVLPEELSVPPLPEVDVGASDDFLVSGFFDKEGGAERTYRWTGTCASVYLAGARPGATVVITASSDKRPAGRPALVRVSLSGRPLGQFVAGPSWNDHAFAIPDPLPAGPPVLRLDVLDPLTGRAAAWRPENELPGSTDSRDLGIVVDRVRVEPGAASGPAGATLVGSSSRP